MGIYLLERLLCSMFMLGFLLNVSAIDNNIGILLDESASGFYHYSSLCTYGEVPDDRTLAALAKQAFQIMGDELKTYYGMDESRDWPVMAAVRLGKQVLFSSSIKVTGLGDNSQSFIYDFAMHQHPQLPIMVYLNRCQMAGVGDHKNRGACGEVIAIFQYLLKNPTADITRLDCRVVTYGVADVSSHL